MRREIKQEAIARGATEIAARLRSKGHEAYLVGGCVRDLLHGRPVADWDIATDASPEVVSGIFSRVIPTGLRHGTVTVRLHGSGYEVSTYRGSKLPAANLRGREKNLHTDSKSSLESDLELRDFTLNAIALDPIELEIVDPTGGEEDLGQGCIRAVGDPDARLSEDPLRALRGIRLAAELGFTIEKETFEAIKRAAGKITAAAPERIGEEFKRILLAPRPSAGIELMRRCGALDVVLPDLAACAGVGQNRFHAYDVYRHTLEVCDAAPRDWCIRLAALFHDIGKPGTKAYKKEDYTFYDHEIAGKKKAGAAMRKLRYSEKDAGRVLNLITHHMFNYTEAWSDNAVRRFVRKVGIENIGDLFALRRADTIGRGKEPNDLGYLDALRGRIDRSIKEDAAFSVRDLAIDGSDVMRELGLPGGRKVGKVLDALLEAVLDDPSLNKREKLLAYIRKNLS